MSPFFSIIIPTLNSALTIRRAIGSVLTQRYENFELLVIDGFSIDNTLNIIKELNDKRLKLISEKDDGVFDAMNKGILRSKSDWIYFLGSDDYLVNEYVLENAYHEINKSNPDFLYGKVISGEKNTIYGQNIKLKDLYFLNICHQAIFTRKALLVKHGLFNIGYLQCADWDMNLKIFRDKDVKIIYTPMIIAFFNTGGISSQSAIEDEAYQERKSLFKKYFSLRNRCLLFLSKKLYWLSERLIPSK